MSRMNDIMHDPEVRKVDLLCDKPECYAVRFEDGSAMLVNAEGDRIKSPLDRYDFISDVQFIGRMNGVPHFAFEAVIMQPAIRLRPGCSIRKAIRSSSVTRVLPESKAWTTSNGNSSGLRSKPTTKQTHAGTTLSWWISIHLNNS